MNMGRKQRMSFQEAMDMTPDNLPDGAFFAMAHEIAGLEYGDGFDELGSTKGMNGPQEASYKTPEFKITPKLLKKIEATGHILIQHDAYHFTIRHGKKHVADWWPHKKQWRMGGETVRGDEKQFVLALTSLPKAIQGQ